MGGEKGGAPRFHSERIGRTRYYLKCNMCYTLGIQGANALIIGGSELPGRGEGQGTGHQPDFRRAPGDEGIWGAESGGSNSSANVEVSWGFGRKRSLTRSVTRVTF